MKILIATGVYPPEIGGPAYYAKSLKEEFEKLGHEVVVKTYGSERHLPSGVRHLAYFLKTLPAYLSADWTLVLDTFSVGLPVAIMRKLFGGIAIMRTGGDFLWEHFVERTGEKVLFSRFYGYPRALSFKERLILRATAFVTRTMSVIAFSTAYQRDIWIKAYGIDERRVRIVENRYGRAADGPLEPTEKHFVYCAARDIAFKNADTARAALALARESVPDISLEFLFDVPRDEAIERIRSAYACVLASLGDISPNYVLRALSYGKPVILTSENGIRDRVGEAAVYVDPLDPGAIARAMVGMCDPAIRSACIEKAKALSYEHSYADIARELLAIARDERLFQR